MKKRKHVTRSSGLAKTILQGRVQGKRKKGRQRRRWEDKMTEWTGKALSDNPRWAEDRDRWRELVVNTVMPTKRVD